MVRYIIIIILANFLTYLQDNQTSMRFEYKLFVLKEYLVLLKKNIDKRSFREEMIKLLGKKEKD